MYCGCWKDRFPRHVSRLPIDRRVRQPQLRARVAVSVPSRGGRVGAQVSERGSIR